MQYLFLSAGGIDACQAGRVEEAAVVQPDADEVGRAVGGRADQQAAGGDAMVHLQQDRLHEVTDLSLRDSIHFLITTHLKSSRFHTNKSISYSLLSIIPL